MSAKEIGAMTGHKTLKELERYTAAADQAKMTEQAMSHLSRVGDSPKRK